MIIVVKERQKEFGQVKKENKAKKREWMRSSGMKDLKNSYTSYLNSAKEIGEPLDLDNYTKDELKVRANSIISDRNWKNSFDDNKLKRLKKVNWDDAAVRYGRSNRFLEGKDKLSEKASYFGDLKEYYKSKLDRKKFDKLKGKNERDLMDFLRSEAAKKNGVVDAGQEAAVSKKSNPIPFVKKVKRLVRKNLNKLLK